MKLAVALVVATITVMPARADEVSVADVAPPVAMSDFRGREFTDADFAGSRVLVMTFLGTECPLARLYGRRLQELADQFSDDGVAFVGVFSNSQDGVTDIDYYARRQEVRFPLLKDVGNKFADAAGATRTPEVFVYDDQRKLRYRGRIDQQYGVGYGRHERGTPYLEDAITALLSGQQIAVAHTEPVGCIIGRVREADPTSEITYANQVARILQKHCVECHRDGEIAPFTLTDYDEVSGWADTIAEVVRDQRMPPWGADPAHGEFTNARGLSDEEKETLYRWAAAGAPQGDVGNLPVPREFVDGWRLPRDPDVVIAMSEEPFDVPAEGIIEYQYFSVDPGFTEDKWVKASDIVPGDRSVVHHTIVYISPPGSEERRLLGWLSAYVPGQSSMLLPTGHARLIPAGSQLIFEQHYTPNGRRTTDCTKIGLVFADQSEVDHEVITLYAVNNRFEIRRARPLTRSAPDSTSGRATPGCWQWRRTCICVASRFASRVDGPTATSACC